MKTLPVDISDFKEMKDKDYFYVDKFKGGIIIKKLLIGLVIVITIINCSFINTNATPKVNKNGEVAGNIYYTDIKAYLKNTPINAFNIGGKTVIECEGLNWYYLFDVYWYSDKRELTVDNKSENNVMDLYAGKNLSSSQGKIGDIAGQYYYSDITTYLDGKEIESYNIGGKTVIPMEAMVDYGYNVTWDNDKREIRAVFEGLKFDTDIGTCSRASLENFSYDLNPKVVYNGQITIDDKPILNTDIFIHSNIYSNYYVSLKQTLEALNIPFQWDSNTNTLNINWDNNLKINPISDKEDTEKKPFDILPKDVKMNIVSNGKIYPILSGLIPYGHFDNAEIKRFDLYAYEYKDIVYIPISTLADILGLNYDEELNMTTK